MDTVSISRHDGTTPNPIKGKGVRSTKITNNILEICHAKGKQKWAKGFDR